MNAPQAYNGSFHAARTSAFEVLRAVDSVYVWSPSESTTDTLPAPFPSRTASMSTTLLFDASMRCHMGILSAKRDAIAAWLHGITDSVNPLQVLSKLCDLLPPNSPIVWQYNENGACGTHGWRSFWVSCAQRLGFDVEFHGFMGGVARTPSLPLGWMLYLANNRDTEDIRDLFSIVFGGVLSPELYQWKYGDTAAGSVIARVNGKVIAHCGALMRRITILGAQSQAAQLVDVMVHPDYRGILRRRGVFFDVTATTIEIFGPLAFGFPNSRHLKLGQKHGFYEPADKVIELQWVASKFKRNLQYSLVSLDFSLSNHRRQYEKVWQAMSNELKENVVGVRDINWIEYRYIRHPHHRHLLYAVINRWTGVWKGVVIARKEDRHLLVLDWIGSMRALPTLVDAAAHIATTEDLSAVTTWIDEGFARFFESSQPKIIDPDVTVPTIIWCQDGRESHLRNWWLSPGDSDFR